MQMRKNTNIDYNSKLNLKETEIKTLEENFLHSEKLKNLVEQEHSELKNEHGFLHNLFPKN